MGRRIRRRDFLNGVALAAGASLAPPGLLRALHADGDPYPPALTGLRGSHDGSYEAAHLLRDGRFWETAGPARDTGERYDLVVVGAGISGLAGSWFFRQAAGADARILILDNHDDFGGHARRNEFREGGRMLLGYGGTFAIDSPAPYSEVAKGLIRELGVDVSSWARALDQELYAGLRPALFFDKRRFGVDRLVPDPRREPWDGVDDEGGDVWRRFLAEAPLTEAVKRDLVRLHQERKDYLPGLSSHEKKARLARVSYADFLTRIVGLDPGVLPFFQARAHSLYGYGMDAIPAQDAWGMGFPGFQGMGLDPAPGPGMNHDAIRHPEASEYFFHFPDGNATLARLLVRRLIPAAVPGTTAEDVVTARVRYGKLDEAASPARIRLESTVARVAQRDTPGGGEVEVAYVRGGRLESVRAGRALLACWHTVIPYLCPELPAAQREALAYAIKVPIVYTNVLTRDWTAWKKLGIRSVHAPGGYFSSLNLDLPVSVGGYSCPRRPEDPMVLHLVRTPCSPGLPSHEQHRAGRTELLATTFATFERLIRQQLAAILGPGGFDPARDIRAITVNRWPHGYAYQYNSLWDPFWLEGGETPCQAARRPFGRIAIANADAAAYSYTDAAIDQARRAVDELLKA
jgi:spermidine dehydrogenase